MPLNFADGGTSERWMGLYANPFANQWQIASVTCAPFSYALGAFVAREGFLKSPLQPMTAPDLKSEQTFSNKPRSKKP